MSKLQFNYSITFPTVNTGLFYKHLKNLLTYFSAIPELNKNLLLLILNN